MVVTKQTTACGNQVGDCPGHFGIIELARPVIHVGYANIVVYKLLKSTCRSCNRILLDPAVIDLYNIQINDNLERGQNIPANIVRNAVKEARKKKKCPHCGAEQYKIKFEKPTTFIEETEAGTERLTPAEIQKRFENILPEDLPLIGLNHQFSRPEWTIMNVLPVPPVSVRASITLESGVRSEDDLTHKLVDIIRINQRLKENIEAGAPQLIVEDLWELLQYHVTTYMDNEVAGIPPARHRSGRALRTLSQRLRGKEGRFRGNLSGKRVDFSARTVISPDPLISINEVGVPEAIAKILTVPERVTEWNIEEMKELVLNGPARHPGSNYIIRPDGKRVDLRFVSDLSSTAEVLDQGFVVERHLRDGDIVLFNRQPSLHRMSIMAHEVRVVPYRTFRLHLCVCTPYNADFDGDEMNLHVPQSEEARAETRVLMRVQEQILSPRYGGPIIGAIHDYVSAAFLLTRKKTLFTREQSLQLLLSGYYTGELPPPAIEHPVNLWTGKQIFSCLLPRELTHTAKSATCGKCKEGPIPKCDREGCRFDSYVFIKDGTLLSGVIDRRAIGADESESVLHVVVKEWGSDRARMFIDSLTQMLIEFMSHIGFSIGFSNINIPSEGKLAIEEITQKAEQKVQELIESYERGQLKATHGKTLRETLEMRIMKELSDARNGAGEIAGRYMGLSNSALVMVKTGAKGNNLNIAQMSACIGQQSIRGERILRGYKNRALPHFRRGDIGAFERGFVRTNYREGLDPIEFFFHAQGGREGLVDTAVRTSTSGYLQRRLVNALQDLRVDYDNAVRTADSDIIQLRYGEDGVDPMKSFHGRPIDIQAIINQVIHSQRAIEQE